MANKILESFQLTRYGVNCRLVVETDAEFIIELRCNPKLSKFIHPTKNDVSAQRAWIRDYKEREKKGEEYYFIYSYNDKPFGVNRIYNIGSTSATGGSWVCSPGLTTAIITATDLIKRDIIFDVLGLNKEDFNVEKGNSSVLNFHRLIMAQIIGENDHEYYLSLTRENYKKGKDKIIRLLNLK